MVRNNLTSWTHGRANDEVIDQPCVSLSRIHSGCTIKYLETIPNRFEFIFTPKHGSWLNLVEGFFSKLSRVFLRGLRVSGKEELKERLLQYIDQINLEPVVFRWKYKMDEIIL